MLKDIFIIGGGIQGAGIAADAAGRGLSVTLCERSDLASGTSSASTKLIHGGLRYLENYEFNLVRKALNEREILLRKAAHIIAPLEFIFPYEKQLRPAWLIRLGLFLYDHLAKREHIPGSRAVHFSNYGANFPLQDPFKKGFSYYDCFTDDARLVIENALAAKENGAEILTRTEFISAHREKNHWKIRLKNTDTSEEFFYSAKLLVNATGPWLKEVNQKILNNNTDFSLQLVKGSHIVIPKLYDDNFAFILQNSDKRIVFAIPYQSQFTLIGTTDVAVSHPHPETISDQEKNYLCDTINHHFKKNISTSDIVWSYSGIRCLQDQTAYRPSEITRDYKIIVASENKSAPLITIIGGKITTFRQLAEDVLKKIAEFLPEMGAPWTAHKPLPGGAFNKSDFNAFYQQFKQDYDWLPEQLSIRYAKTYGARIYLLLQNTQSLADLGNEFGADLYQKEIEYLIRYEWARTIDDILWRRTKLGLFFPKGKQEALMSWVSLSIKKI